MVSSLARKRGTFQSRERRDIDNVTSLLLPHVSIQKGVSGAHHTGDIGVIHLVSDTSVDNWDIVLVVRRLPQLNQSYACILPTQSARR